MKYQVVHNAAILFQLTDQEAETLANKAGLTLHSDKPFSEALKEILQKYGIKGSICYRSSTISERMYQYIAKGRKPTKETVLALSLSLDLKLEEIEMLLKNAGYVLSKALPNDMVIFYILTHRQECKAPLLFHINEVLQELGLPLLLTR